MKKMYIIITLIIFLIIIASLAYYIKSKKQISINGGSGIETITIEQLAKQRAQIAKLGTKEFSCVGMEGFTFLYPLFSESYGAIPGRFDSNSQSCVIFLNGTSASASTKTDPYINVLVIYYDNIPNLSGPGIQTSPKGVKYNEISLNDHSEPQVGGLPYQFYGKDFEVRISLFNIPANSGFDSNLFWRAVIDSFEFTPKK